MRIIDKYTEAVTSEQTKLISYVKQMTAKISIPDAAVTTKVIKPARHNTVSVACITGGALALIAGLCLEKKWYFCCRWYCCGLWRRNLCNG